MELLASEQLLIPREAYRYSPPKECIFSGSEKNILRFIFYNTEFTCFELAALKEFKEHLASRDLPSYFSDEELIRLLLAKKFDKKKALKGLEDAIAWREANPFSLCFEKSVHLHQSGGVYIQGIDHRFRPLIVLNLARIDFKKYSVSDYAHLLCFTLEYAIQNMMIKGKIENWMVITDLGNYPLLKLPVSDLKKLIKVLQENYKCRMVVNYVVNAPSSISLAWGMVRGLLDAHTVQKIKIQKDSRPDGIFEHFARNQVEEKYGGTFPNRTVFWPLELPGPPYHIEDEDPEEHLASVSDTDFSIGPIPEEASFFHVPFNIVRDRREEQKEEECCGPEGYPDFVNTVEENSYEIEESFREISVDKDKDKNIIVEAEEEEEPPKKKIKPRKSLTRFFCFCGFKNN